MRTGGRLGDTWILELHDSHFPELLTAIPSMTQRVVRLLLDRNREYTRAEEQIGKLAALNKLAANLAHELNNPASAAKSARLASAERRGQANKNVLLIELEWPWAQRTGSTPTSSGFPDSALQCPTPAKLRMVTHLSIPHRLKIR